ncbi:MAG: hypothetical protein GQ570_10265 [Helicobacteraceae bacterium]|nr:hypothetical protein [Helicobacteraceae bacterium]
MQELEQLSLKEREKLFTYLRIYVTHTSSSLDGATITLAQTKELLTTKCVNNMSAKHEQLIILGFAKAYDLIIKRAVKTKLPLDAKFLKLIHNTIYQEALNKTPDMISNHIGEFKVLDENMLDLGVEVPVSEMIHEDINDLFKKTSCSTMSLVNIFKFHVELKEIKPFTCGNIQVAMLVMLYQSIQNNIVPILITPDKYRAYLKAVENNKTIYVFLDECTKNSMKLI